MTNADAADARGTVVVVDVLRAFTTAAYAFGAGASEIWLVAGVDEALELGVALGGAVVMGEDRGRRPAGFDLPNSPVMASTADLAGRVVVQRTSAGTQGVVAARAADRLFAASLVCASATAAAVTAVGSSPPTYVITGRVDGDDRRDGTDDQLTAELIDRARRGAPLDVDRTAEMVASSAEAERTLAVGDGHVHPDDIAYAVDVDRFDFAMEVQRLAQGLRLTPTRPRSAMSTPVG